MASLKIDQNSFVPFSPLIEKMVSFASVSYTPSALARGGSS